MNVAYLSARKRETEVIAGMSELPCGMRVARNKGTEGTRETVRPILIVLLVAADNLREQVCLPVSMTLLYDCYRYILSPDFTILCFFN